MNIKKAKRVRYSMFWLNLSMRVLMPIGIIAWQFGVFEDEVSVFSRVRGTFLIGLVIASFIIRKDIMDYIKKLENKGWYRSVRATTLWLIVLLILWFTQTFLLEMIWVVGSFAIGSAQSLITEPLHQKNINIINKYNIQQEKLKEKELEIKLEESIKKELET